MLFGFECQKCNKRFDVDFPIGKAPRATPCPSCKGSGKRVYAGMSIAVKINGHTSLSTSFGEQMKKKNMQSSSKLHGKSPPVRLTAWDYGNGNIREV